MVSHGTQLISTQCSRCRRSQAVPGWHAAYCIKPTFTCTRWLFTWAAGRWQRVGLGPYAYRTASNRHSGSERTEAWQNSQLAKQWSRRRESLADWKELTLVSSLYTLLSLSASVSGSVEIIIYTSLNLCSSLRNNLLRSNDLFSTQDGHQRTLCKHIKPMCFSRCSYIDLFDRE